MSKNSVPWPCRCPRCGQRSVREIAAVTAGRHEPGEEIEFLCELCRLQLARMSD